MAVHQDLYPINSEDINVTKVLCPIKFVSNISKDLQFTSFEYSETKILEKRLTRGPLFLLSLSAQLAGMSP